MRRRLGAGDGTQDALLCAGSSADLPAMVRATIPLMVRLEVDGIELTYSEAMFAGFDD